MCVSYRIRRVAAKELSEQKSNYPIKMRFGIKADYIRSATKIVSFGGTGAVPDDLVKLIAKASV